MTAARAGGAGGRWISARRRRSSRRRRRGSSCRQHGVVVARVPWARHGSWFTREFEDQVAWLATHCSKSAVCELMRISLADGRPDHRAGGRRAVAPGAATRSRGCAGSGSTSSPTARGSATSPSSSTTTRAGWSGPPTAATSRPSRASSTQLGAGALRPARARLQRPGRVDHARGRSSAARSATLCLDPFHVVALASERARRGAPRGLERRPAAPATRAAPAGSKAPAGRSGNDRND